MPTVSIPVGQALPAAFEGSEPLLMPKARGGSSAPHQQVSDEEFLSVYRQVSA
jgi:hypothetical protein